MFLLSTAIAPSTANATWGQGCSEGKHCYAFAEVGIKTFAAIGLQDTHFSTVYDCGSGGFVDNEMWNSFAGLEGWIEVGQAVGSPYCDQVPHLFNAEETSKGVYHEYLSPAAVPENSYNWYAISDLAEENGLWHVYYSSPPGYTGWNNWAEYGGSWPRSMSYEESGMEVATEVKPSYEGSSETAYTNESLTPYVGWSNWYGARLFAESGSTCILPLPPGEGEAPGNSKFGACGA
ncbi:MAG TPA: hypothetical protein VHS55_02460 [Solirubrobacteraceae bacterium]|nr:hypothetical protein [Solirubrobacteraceae bacterium]